MASKKEWKLKVDSSTKMIVWFEDGNIRTFYSLDWNNKRSKVKKREIGLARFYRMIEDYNVKARTAEIYDLETGKRIAKFCNGKEIEIDIS